ncbi:MAG: T9SS type A sorting domain-containing protein, partial [Vicingaceae bacterium]
ANIEYCHADSARTSLINSGWTFDGDSLNCQTVGLDTRLSRVETEFTVYPNPSNNVLNIESNENLVGELIQVYNMQGQIVIEETIESINFKLETAGLENGVYLIRVNSISTRFVVQH